MRCGQRPCKQSHAEEGHNDDFDNEHPPECVYRQKEEWQLSYPEERKTEQVRCGDGCALWQCVLMPVLKGRPNRLDHAPYSIPADGALHAHPDYTYHSADHHGDVGAPKAEARSR